ncbi:uncharacterized protein LOC142139677 isoform X2 [Mixophyes fleayi]|uniref:uncharacterized protein LOC142139677 isoform X2 n=1 Tax=Mixophyes fleayi TaxID=3061075 RepID=UPI003F4E2A0B
MKLVLLLLLYVATGEAEVRSQQIPPSLVLSKGQMATMTCTITDDGIQGPSSYSWSLHGSPKEVVLKNNPRFKVINHPDRVSSSLIISSVTPMDSGLYLCSGTMLNGSDQIKHPAEPVVSIRLGVMELGRQLLTCKVSGFYPPMINISYSVSMKTLMSEDIINKNMDGTYTKTCTIEITRDELDSAIMDDGVTCNIEHSSLSHPISFSLSPQNKRPGAETCASDMLYLQILPVRVLLVTLLVFSLIIFKVILHLTYSISPV